MKRKRIMIVGPARVGKTALANAIEGEARPLKRTQDTIYRARTLEVPSGYLENTWMYQHLIALGQDAWCLLVLIDQSRPVERYAPGFVQSFRLPVVGVITHCDKSPENRPLVEAQLARTGVRPPFFAVDLESGTGVEALLTHLHMLEGGKGACDSSQKTT